MPGITTHVIVNPNRVGTFQVICAELCGAGHGVMRARVIVMEPAGLRRLARPGPEGRRRPGRAARGDHPRADRPGPGPRPRPAQGSTTAPRPGRHHRAMTRVPR